MELRIPVILPKTLVCLWLLNLVAAEKPSWLKCSQASQQLLLPGSIATYEEAVNNCESHGATLVTMSDALEMIDRSDLTGDVDTGTEMLRFWVNKDTQQVGTANRNLRNEAIGTSADSNFNCFT